MQDGSCSAGGPHMAGGIRKGRCERLPLSPLVPPPPPQASPLPTGSPSWRMGGSRRCSRRRRTRQSGRHRWAREVLGGGHCWALSQGWRRSPTKLTSVRRLACRCSGARLLPAPWVVACGAWRGLAATTGLAPLLRPPASPVTSLSHQAEDHAHKAYDLPSPICRPVFLRCCIQAEDHAHDAYDFSDDEAVPPFREKLAKRSYALSLIHISQGIVR